MNKLRVELTIIYKYLFDECLKELTDTTSRLNFVLNYPFDFSSHEYLGFFHFSKINRTTWKCWHISNDPVQCSKCLNNFAKSAS